MSKSFQFASISHELRSAIANIAQLADQLSKLKKYDESLVNQIQLSSSFLLRVVESVIDEDRNLNVREVRIDKIIEEVMGIRAQDAIPLEVWVQPDVPMALELCDTAVSRILRNLIQNIDSHSGASHAEVHVSVEADVLLFVIKDNGNGISQDVRKKLFFPKKDAEVGHGIGLFLCALIAQKAGGELQCVHPEAGDCTFEFRVPFKSIRSPLMPSKVVHFPLELPTAARSSINMLKQRFALTLKKGAGFPRFEWQDQSLALRLDEKDSHQLRDYPYFTHLAELLNQRPEVQPQGRHWLVVEDDPIVMQVTALMMKSKGLRVSKAKTSEECKNAITSGIDVVLMDVFLSGESGVELAQELRKSGYRGLIIGMSAESKALEDIAIFDKTILKPLSLESLNTLLKQLEGA